MVAIDDMTENNGCLRLACPEAGAPCWSEQHAPDHHKGDTAGDPDAGGRAGGLTAAADALSWHSLPCDAGSVWLFNGWVPHRSAANLSNMSRKAVFFTYNPRVEGSVRELYYTCAAEKRRVFAMQAQEAMARELEGRERMAAAYMTVPGMGPG
eukprot:Tamp_11409.p1 GENE.Tamp_11409~~Tamp_11409.p1  ORF type:complete len:153 (+),score=25.41 Tamp_11409:1097-1555(+)